MGVKEFFSQDCQTFYMLLEQYPEATNYVYKALVAAGKFYDGIHFFPADHVSKNIPFEHKKIVARYDGCIREVNKYIENEKKVNTIQEKAMLFPHAYLYFCKKEGIICDSIYEPDKSVRMPGEIAFTSFSPESSSYDSNFKELVSAELGKYGYSPRIATQVKARNSSMGLDFRTIPQLINIKPLFGGAISLHGIDGLKSSISKDFLKYGITFVGRDIKVVPLKENCASQKLFLHLSEFEIIDKQIVVLLKREKIWKDFEDAVLLNQLGRVYYKDFFWKKYGTDTPSLQRYESLVSDNGLLDEFNAYIKQQEADYNALAAKMPFGTKQFEKEYPGIPHARYREHSDRIRELEIQSKAVFFSKRQTELSDKIRIAFLGDSKWSLKDMTINCAEEDFNGNVNSGTCKCLFLYRYAIYRRQYYPNEERDFEYCPEVVTNAAMIDSITKESIYQLLGDILPRLVSIYIKAWKRIRFVLDEDIVSILDVNHANTRRVFGEIINLPGLSKYRDIIDVSSFSHFDNIQANYLPHVFIFLNNEGFALNNLYFWRLVPQHIISSVVTIGRTFGAGDLAIYNGMRCEEELNRRERWVKEMQQKYPYGYLEFCKRHQIDGTDYVKVYQQIKDGEAWIIESQRSEDARIAAKREAERKESVRRQARLIAERYPHALKELFQKFSNEISYEEATVIIRNEARLKELTDICYNDHLFDNDGHMCGVLYKSFFPYYPQRRFTNEVLSREDIRNREFVWSFKDGRATGRERATQLLIDFLKSSELAKYKEKITFVCVPASSNMSNMIRYESFCNKVCNELGYRNGYGHFTISSCGTPRHMGGTTSTTVEFTDDFFNGSFILLFDDVLTSGGTANRFKTQLESVGGRVIGLITLGRTV